jgi:hypothetical protein
VVSHSVRGSSETRARFPLARVALLVTAATHVVVRIAVIAVIAFVAVLAVIAFVAVLAVIAGITATRIVFNEESAVV